MKIHMIFAHSHFGLGINGKLAWHIKEEMNLFKHLTENKTVIMGRKTFESLPGSDGLSNRFNIVISSKLEQDITKKYSSNVIFVSNIIDAINEAKEYEQDTFIIGGKSLYETTLEYVTGNVYISSIKKKYNCDIFISEEFFEDLKELNFVNILEDKNDKYILYIYKRIKDI